MMEVFESVLATVAHGVGYGIFGGLYSDAGEFLSSSRHRRSLIEETHYPDQEEIRSIEKESEFVPGTSIYGGICFDHFGHFLAESLGRLWPATQPENLDTPIYMHLLFGRPDILKQSNYIHQALVLLGIAPQRVKFIMRPTQFERLLVPEQLYGFHMLSNPSARFVDFIKGAQSRLGEYRDPALPRRLYVSRTKWSSDRGRVAGEAHFERFLLSDGWVAFYPEQYSFMEQLVHYDNASDIIFAEGSAYHSLVLTPDLRASVTMIMRRPSGVNNSASELMAGLGLQYNEIQQVKKLISLGLPSYNSMSIVDYGAVSQELVRTGLLSRPFVEWRSLETAATNEALSEYLEVFKRDERLLSFLKSLP